MNFPGTFSLIAVLSLSNVFAQQYHIVTIVKKGKEPVIREHMSDYSPTGFYLYENCLYKFKLKEGQVQTARLIGIFPETLVFQTPGFDDSIHIPANSFKYFYFSDNWTPNATQRVKMKNHLMVFSKSAERNFIPSRAAYVLPDRLEKYELIPSPTKERIVYYFYYEGRLFYHSGEEIEPPKYSDEERQKALNAILTAMDILINKRVDIVIQKD